MSKTKNNCRGCGACRRIYYKGYFGFCAYRDMYYCAEHNKVINLDCGCERKRTKKPSYDFSAERFDDVIKDIEFLMDYYGDF